MMKKILSNKWFWTAIAAAVVIFIIIKVRSDKKTDGQAGGASEGKKAGDIITRVVGGVQKKYQVQPNGQVKDVETGQLVNLIGYKKVGTK